jgi:hypothetical protein
MDDISAQLVLSYLVSGDTVAESVSAAQRQNLGQSDVGGVVATLGFLGDGENTLAKVRGVPLVKLVTTSTPTPTATSTPTATPTATATPTPTATLKPRSQAVKCKKGTKLVKGKCRKVVTCKRGFRLVHGKCRPTKPRCKSKRCKQTYVWAGAA